MKEIIALGFSDLHLQKWKAPETYKGNRLNDAAQAFNIVHQESFRLSVPILFCGDLVHNHKAISNEVFDKISTLLKPYRFDSKLYGISGNHDQSEKNTFTHRSPSYIHSLSQLLPGIKCIDNGYLEEKEFIVAGIPYYTNNLGFLKAKKELELALKNSTKPKILLIHRDLPGAETSSGYEVNEHEDLKGKSLIKMFRKWNLVLSGHIHKPQKIKHNIIMLGAPYHQNSGDRGTEMGYWEIYSDMSVVFKKLILPEYKLIPKGKTAPDEFHIWMPIEEIIKTDILESGKFTNKTNKTLIAKRYLKKKGIKSKSKKKTLLKALK